MKKLIFIIKNQLHIVTILLFLSITLQSQNPKKIYHVEFISFEASIKDEKVSVNWTTERERFTVAFIVQRSLNGKLWENVITVPSNETNSWRCSYEVSDEHPYRSSAYYRVRCISNNDEECSTPEYFLESIVAEVPLQVYPNPAQDFVVIMGEGLVLSEMHLYEMTGRVIDLTERTMIISEYKVVIDLRSLPTGVYFLRTPKEARRIVKSS